MAKFCPECGNPVSPTSKFCSECGFKLADAQVQPLEEEIGDSTIDAGREPAVKEEMPESPAPDTGEGADEEMGEYRSESTDEDADEGPIEDADEAANEYADETASEDSCEETVEAEDSLGESMPDYGEAASAETDGIAPDELEAEVCLEEAIADDAAETEDLTDEKAGSRKLGGEKKIMAIVGAVVVALIVLIAVLMGTSGGGDDEIDVEAILGETQTITFGSVSIEVPADWDVNEDDGTCTASSNDSSLMVSVEPDMAVSDFCSDEGSTLLQWLITEGSTGTMKSDYLIGEAEVYRFYATFDSGESTGYIQIALSGDSVSVIKVSSDADEWTEDWTLAYGILETMALEDASAPVYSYEYHKEHLVETDDDYASSASSESEDVTESESEVEVEVEETCEIVSNLQTFDLFEETTVTGYGDDVIDVPVAGLPMLMTITNSGSSNFVIWTIDENGDEIDLLVNEIGSYSGTVTTYQDFGDVAMVEVQSSGSWSITFTPMGSMEELENGKEYTGDGVYYIDADSLTKITVNNSGDSNFVIWGVAMEDYDLLVNEIGDYSGTVVWAQPQSFLIVSSDGTWSVSW